MKTLVIFCVLAAVAFALPKDKPAGSECARICTADYRPVCGYDKEPKDGKSFGNKCVLDTYVCEHGGKAFGGVADGECPGSKGIRLS